ncbi:MAG: putative metalloprotease CJM1_0395 family protein [Emcibacteraceae bacterium]|nr:putative metalloprotease CJM1_0395 family protein [Emcibacteraceae bacterium]
MITNVSTQLPPLPSTGEGNASPSHGGFSASEAIAPPPPPPAAKSGEEGELSKEQQAQVDRLKKTDQEVRAHEAAHKNAGGQFAASASYSYTVGPDGQRYATGGEVSIDVAPIKDNPEATIAKLDVVISAALAPAQPSAQDRKVAAAAVAARNQARAELSAKNKAEEIEENEKEPFDVNNFGATPQQSVNKAYETGNGLNLGEQNTGLNLSITG